MLNHNLLNDELDRIRDIYKKRDEMMAYNNWETNIYHPRHPMGQLFHEHNRDILLKVLDYLKIDLTPLKVLDVGCGYGFWLRYMVEIGATPGNLTGIDLSSHRIKIAESTNPAIQWIPNENITLPFPSESFDLVVQALVFSSISDENTRRILAGEINRVTKSGGYIFWVDHRKKFSDKLVGFSASQVLDYFQYGTILYSIPVQPRYFRRLYGRYAWLARAIYCFTKTGCESWFLIIKKGGKPV